MRKRVLLLSLTSMVVSLCVPVSAQQNNMDSLLQRLQELGSIPGVSVERIEKNHEYVDLGLSVMWATCNVGADNPEEPGDFYAWGETSTKKEYKDSNYKWSKGSDNKLTKYCSDKKDGYKNFVDNKMVLDPEDDAAHVNWGAHWRMPTVEEWQELKDNCTWSFETLNGIKGFRVTSNKPGYTDRSIFLPASGSQSGGVNRGGEYFSSSLNADEPTNAWYLSIYCGDDPKDRFASIYKYGVREYSHSVRAVRP